MAFAILDGLASGFVIALMGLGVVVIYRSTRVLTFAQGVIASLNAYLFFQFFVRWELPVLLALALTLVAAVGVGAACERLAIHPLRHADTLTRTVATLGIVLALQAVMRLAWGGREQFLPGLVRGQLTVGGRTVGAQTLLIIGATILTTALLAYGFRRTLTGLSLAAMADNPASARLLGVSPDRVSIATWMIASVLGALAGVLATPLLVLNPWQMTFIMVASYAAALIGGFVSLPLTLAGGVLIGVVRSVVTSYTTVGGLSESLGFIAVFAVLLMRRGGKQQLVETMRQEASAL